MSIRNAFIVIPLLLVLSRAVAEETLEQGPLMAALENKIELTKKLASHPVVVSAVRMQNANNMSMASVWEIDENWKAGSGNVELKKAMNSAAVGRLLKRKVTSNAGIYNEVILTDYQGANVYAYPEASDYWQGDEIKWAAAYNNSKGKVYVGPLKHDKSTNSEATQISVPVMHSGRAIGVLILGVKLSYIESKKLKQAGKM